MTLQQLTYAVTIAETASMNKAAQALFLSQSSLSASILNLEKELGFSLFRRTNRGVSVTPEGSEFLIYARQIVNQYRLTEEKFILKKESKKSFSVSAQHYTFAVKAFIEMARRFQPEQYAFGIYECKTGEIIENVRSYKSELGVLYVDDFNEEILQRLFADNGLTFTELFPCKTYVFLAAAHPLARRASLSLEDLQPYPCLCFDQGENQSFYLAEEVYSTWHYRQVIKASDRATLLNLMIGLNGYTLCSGILCEDLNGTDYRVIPLQSDKIMHIGYIRRQGSILSKLGEIYLEELQKCNVHILPEGGAL
ncbi:MAG: LysR family transcriptional regulator [Faecalibacterium sp.]|nr:LysR family transcriptional regulator [Faecalibacterium sp.]